MLTCTVYKLVHLPDQLLTHYTPSKLTGVKSNIIV